MIKRPTAEWRKRTQEQQQAIADGSLSPDEAYAPSLWPLDFVDAVAAPWMLSRTTRLGCRYQLRTTTCSLWSSASC